ncbi:MAG: DNA primase [Gammaproteobacteria bacterium]|nr:DNA primase [Gammaproteobacteria bacterium]
MAGRIPQSFIDELIARADIVEVINARVPLKKKGREYTACCPFHNEKTPSFTVSETKQFYHCFGCGAHGTAIGFLMEYEHLDFVDAIETLAAEYHVEVPREDSAVQSGHKRDEKQPLYDVLEQTSQLYQQQLRHSDRAVAYLKQRGLSGEIARRYQLGYAPEGWHFLLDNMGNNTNYINNLKTAGMIVEKSPGKRYDRFRDRIMFPILDRRGRTIAFGGRIIDEGEPKYLNSPETPIFHKGYELYGFYEARQRLRNLHRIVVVEGYMDVVALSQHGIEYAVASLGTATTRDQIQKLFRSVQEVIFCFDGDQAGHKAAWRALENTLPILRDGLQARFLFLPDGEDPDSMVRKEGKDAFEKRLQSALPLPEYLFDNLLKEIDTGTMDGRARLAKKARPLLAGIPESVIADLMYKRLAELVGISDAKLKDQRQSTELEQTTPQTITRRTGREVKQNALRDAIALLLQHPEISHDIEVPVFFATAPLQGFALLHNLHDTIKTNPGISSSALIERWRGKDDFDILQKLMQRNVHGTDEKASQLAVFSDALKSLTLKYNDQRFEALEQKLKQEGLSQKELEEYKTLLAR